MSKINKLGKSTFVIAILSLILVAVLSFGGTYAYFSAKSNAATGTVTMGHLKITEDSAVFGSSTITSTETVKAVPNQTVINGPVSVGVDSNINYFIRAIVTSSTVLKNGHTTSDSCADKDVNLFTLTLTTTGWAEGLAKGANGETYMYLTKAQTPSETTKSLTIVAKINSEVGKESSQHYMDAVITVTVKFEVIQADYIIDDGAAVAGTTDVDVAKLETAWTTANVGA